MRKLLYEIYNALAGIVDSLTPEEPEPQTEVNSTRSMKKKGAK